MRRSGGASIVFLNVFSSLTDKVAEARSWKFIGGPSGRQRVTLRTSIDDLIFSSAGRTTGFPLPFAEQRPALPFGDQLRLEGPGAVAWGRNSDLALIGEDRLRTRPVAAVAAAAAYRIALLVAQLVSHFPPKRPLDQGILQLLEKPVFPRQVLGLRIVGKQLIK